MTAPNPPSAQLQRAVLRDQEGEHWAVLATSSRGGVLVRKARHVGSRWQPHGGLSAVSPDELRLLEKVGTF